MIADNTPVIVGVGQITENLGTDSYKGLSNVELAAEAARIALDDSSQAEQLLANLDTLIALRTFEHTATQYDPPFGKSNNFPHSIARKLNIEPKHAIWAQAGGDTPQVFVAELCEKIHSGDAEIGMVVGAEAISTTRHLASQGADVNWADDIDAPVDDRGLGLTGLKMRYAVQHKILGGPDAYALLENARRARKGLGREDYRMEMAGWFAPLSQVASSNPYSTTQTSYSDSELATVTERNRMIADPYPRLMVARDQVNQAAAIVICSVAQAKKLGIDESQWVYLHGYAKATERPIQYRHDLSQAPSAPLACQSALNSAGIAIEDVSFLDFYSCFPIAVSNVCDALGIAADDPRGLTVTGGLPYFGGPGNSYSTHAIATMVEQLRSKPGSYGLIGANGGQLSKYAAGVYSTCARDFSVCDSSDIQRQMDELEQPALTFEPEGEAVVETYTVVYGKKGPAYGMVVGRLKRTGERFYANTPEGDQETLQCMIDSDPLGKTIYVKSFGQGNRFTFSAKKLAALYPKKSPGFRDSYEFVSLKRNGHILEITMNRPEVRNALHPPAHEELDEIFNAYFNDPELWVAILTGAGTTAFCAGNDLKYSSKNPVYLPNSGFAAITRRSHRTKPVIAAVNGFAMGGGLEICLACDLVVADESATFGLTEVKVGLVAAEGGLVRLKRRVAPMLANEMILTGRVLNAQEAMSAGLINDLTPAGEAMEGARAMANKILEGSPTSVRVSLEIMRDTESMADELEAVRWRHPGIDDLMCSEDAIEGPVAFSEKRQPNWKNR